MVRKETSDFWVGNFTNRDDYFNFIGEDPDYYQNESDGADKYISQFAKSQNENWIDHDFMESGFENGEGSFFERFNNYSYADQWIKKLSEKITESDLSNINAIVFIRKGKIKNPASVSESNFILRYVGQIEYTI